MRPRRDPDILVDLTMHMARHRLLVFARKPAPVQACWLAYPGTTGVAAIDYRITDRYLDPRDVGQVANLPESRQVANLPHVGPYSEESIRLPDSFWCYDPLGDQPAVNALPAAERGVHNLWVPQQLLQGQPAGLEYLGRRSGYGAPSCLGRRLVFLRVLRVSRSLFGNCRACRLFVATRWQAMSYGARGGRACLRAWVPTYLLYGDTIFSG